MKRTLLLFFGLALAASACGGDGADDVSAAPAVVVEGADESAPVEETDSDSAEDASPADEPDADAVDVDGSASADATDEELALAFVECMRDEGIDFPDPTVAADGSVSLIPPGGAAGLNLDLNDPAVSNAGELCSPLLAGASFLPTGDGDLTELEDTLLAFAACMREQGVDVDDPNLGNGFSPNAIFGGSFDPDDPANADAIAECQGVFGAGGLLGGGE